MLLAGGSERSCGEGARRVLVVELAARPAPATPIGTHSAASSSIGVPSSRRWVADAIARRDPEAASRAA
ncbi:hypothetical protein ACFRLW_24815 [Streptomyces sp. NPDC056728]